MDFRAYATRPDGQLDLLEGAVLVAQDARPGVTFAHVAERLDTLAAPLSTRSLDALPLKVQARALADHLFVREGFRANLGDYYDPDNSFVDRVLERRVGIPLSLSLIYVEVARRAGLTPSPVGFPGHFLARLDAPGEPGVVIDPFNGGGVLTELQLQDLLHRSGVREPLQSSMLEATPVRLVIARMLMNLRGIYAKRGEVARLLVVLDRLLDLMPERVQELRERGLLLARLGAPQGAMSDLRRYLELVQGSEDSGNVAEVLRRIEQSAHVGAQPS